MTEIDKKSLLLAFDDTTAADYLAFPLRHDFDTEIWTPREPDGVLDRLRERSFDVVVASHALGDMAGLDLLAEIRKSEPETVRVLVVSSSAQVDMESALADGTIHQYVLQPIRNSLFAEALRRMVETIQPGSQERRRKPAPRGEPAHPFTLDAGLPSRGNGLASPPMPLGDVLRSFKAPSEVPEAGPRRDERDTQELLTQQREQISNLEASRDEMARQRDEMARQREEIARERDDLRHRCGEAASDLDRYRQALAVLETREQEARLENERLTRQGEQVDRENESLRGENRLLRNDIWRMEREVADLDRLRHELDSFRAQSGMLQRSQSEYRRLTEQNEILFRENEQIEARIHVTTRELEALRNDMAGFLEEVGKELDRLQVGGMGKSDSSRTDIRALRSQPANRSEFAGTPRMGQSPSQWHRDLERGRTGIDRNLDSARNQLPDRIEKSLEMQRQLETLNIRFDEMEKEKADLMERLAWMQKMWGK